MKALKIVVSIVLISLAVAIISMPSWVGIHVDPIIHMIISILASSVAMGVIAQIINPSIQQLEKLGYLFLMAAGISLVMFMIIAIASDSANAQSISSNPIELIEDSEAVERFYHNLYKSVDTVYMHMSDTVVVATIHETSNGIFLLNIGRHGGVYYNKTEIMSDIRKIMRVGLNSFYYLKED